MIYRKRIHKRGYGVSLTTNMLKIQFGKHVWYYKFIGVGKPWSKYIRGIQDVQGDETVTHVRRRNRMTVDAGDIEEALDIGIIIGQGALSKLVQD